LRVRRLLLLADRIFAKHTSGKIRVAVMVKLAYATVRQHPRKVIHVVRVLDELLDDYELNEIAEHVRERALTRHGEPEATVVVVQGDGKETLRLLGEPYAVTRVRAAMFNAALKWRDFAPE
jgi:hypothetical protein